MTTTSVFSALEAQINKLGTKTEDSVDLSELSIIGEGADRVIAFQTLGTDFLLTVEEEVVSVEGTEGDATTYALAEDMKKAVHSFLRWRIAFAQAFGL